MEGREIMLTPKSKGRIEMDGSIKVKSNGGGRSFLGILVLAVVICLSGRAANCATYGGGKGTAEEPYLIYTAEQMNTIGANKGDWSKHFKLMADIDLSGIGASGFNMIGYYISYYDRKPFSGVFDGNGHVISNFTYITSSVRKVGIFVYVDDGGQVINVGLVDPNVYSSASRYCTTGSLVSYMRGGAVEDCWVVGGSVSGYDDVGGLVGYICTPAR